MINNILGKEYTIHHFTQQQHKATQFTNTSIQLITSPDINNTSNKQQINDSKCDSTMQMHVVPLVQILSIKANMVSIRSKLEHANPGQHR